MPKFLVFVFALAAAAACTSANEEGCVEQPPSAQLVAVLVQPLTQPLLAIETKEQLVNFFARHTAVRDHVFLRHQYPNDSTFINTVFQRITNPYFDSLAAETTRVFGEGEKLKGGLNEAFTNLRAYFPNVAIPTIQTIITGMETDLFVSDTLIVIGLDFYMGKGAKYRPTMYEYILRQYVPENIVPSIMLLYGIDARINVTDVNDRTVLADMVAYGKAFHFAKRMLPCTPDSIFMGYSRKELEGARENQPLIWLRLVEDKVLYATGSQQKQRYLGERPKTVEVGPDCPGRIAQWVGWRIVDSYRKNNPEVGLQQLMQVRNADKLFKESKYKPTSNH
jgi:hypothetical protein